MALLRGSTRPRGRMLASVASCIAAAWLVCAAPSPRFAALAQTGCAAAGAGDLAHHHGHGPGTILAHEHGDFERLLRACEATHAAVASGDWSAPATWQGGRVPPVGARVHIPEGVEITIDRAPAHASLGWLRVDGALAIAPASPVTLAFETLAVGQTGSLRVGSRAAPIGAANRVELVVLPRSRESRARDLTDLGGGIIVLGQLSIEGADKTAYAVPATPLAAGINEIAFAAPLDGWAVGDRLLVPAALRTVGAAQDEVATIVAISSDRRTVTLAAPLRHAHVAWGGVPVLPVANLTRHVTVRSAAAEATGDRGHIMIMHTHTGVAIRGAALVGLGRTRADRVHTIPHVQAEGRVEEGTDANTIGRYALHFHMRSGASLATPPHIVARTVIEGSPKHGIVNHGGHLIAEDNVTWRVDGSHLFAENGSEIGAFRRNLAVRSQGSGSVTLARDAIYDFGHEGHGIWSQSSAVEITDNWAIGHAGGGIVVFGYPVKEGGDFVYFDPRNAPGHAPDLPGRIMAVSSPSFRLSGNRVGASRSGIEVWNHKVYARNSGRSVIEGTIVWDVLLHGIFLPYAKSITIRDATLIGGRRAPVGIGITGNDLTEAIHIEGLAASGFQTGVRLATRGANRLVGARLANEINVEIATATSPARTIELSDVAFAPLELPMKRKTASPTSGGFLSGLAAAVRGPAKPGAGPAAAAGGADIVMRDLVVPVNGDAAMLFADDRIYLTAAGREQQLFFPSQAPDAVPFPTKGPGLLRGRTSAEIAATYGIARAGLLAPAAARPLPRSNALVAAKVAGLPPPRTTAAVDPAGLDEHDRFMLLLEAQYPGAFHHFSRKSADGAAEGWNVTREKQVGQHLVFRDRTPPHFILQPSLRQASIHPEDVKYGYRVQGMVYDKVDGVVSVRAFTQDFFDLAVDADGHVRLHFDIHDMAGNVTPVELPLKVTAAAKRRGTHLSYFMEGDCIACEYEQMNAEARVVFGRDLPLVTAQ